MSVQLKRVKEQRKAHRGVVTRLIHEATQILEGEITDKIVTRLRIIDGQLEEKKGMLVTFNEEIIALIDVAEIEGDILESETIMDKIVQMRGEIKAILDGRQAQLHEEISSRSVSPTGLSVERGSGEQVGRLNATVEPDNHDDYFSDPVVSDDHHSRRSPVNLDSRSAGIKLKLPKLHLPKFTGDVTKFRTFWNSFDSAINRNAELSPNDKFNYLKALVEGPAAHAIQGLTLSEVNYTAAIELIKERFRKTQQIISAHIDELIKLPSCTNDKAIQIRSVYDRISVNVRGLESLGIGLDQYGSFLIPIIMAKLPPTVRLQIARVTTREVWDMNELLQVIKREVEARELSEGIKVCELKKSESINRRPPVPTASALVVREDGHSRIKCVYCRGEHYSASCEKINTVPARKEILKREGRCFLCLSNGHRASHCTSNTRCRKCGRKHHQSICEPNPPAKETETAATASKETTVNLARNKTCVLLQTARTYAYTTDDELIPVRILMDVGSQRSYLSNALKAKLKLKPLRQEHLTLNTFGNEQFNKRRCDLVNVKLQVKHGEKIEISALSFPAICSPLQVPVEVDKYPHLQDLDLADASSSKQSSDVDMLIGSDYYWDVIIGDLKRGGNGPVAVSSKFGWLLSGPMKSKRGEDGYTVTNLVIEGFRKVELISEQHTDEHDSELDKDLRLFWDTEAIGIMEEAKSISLQQCFVDLKFDWTQGRYQVSLPWKTDYRPQNNGYEMCIARLNQLRTKLQRDKSLFQEYHSVLMAQLQDGIIELVPNSKDVSYSHFLPHHGVRKRDRQTTKLRIVFDASASRSLNDCLEKGPNGIPHLFDILLKFRSNPIGLVADIEKAFH